MTKVQSVDTDYCFFCKEAMQSWFGIEQEYDLKTKLMKSNQSQGKVFFGRTHLINS